MCMACEEMQLFYAYLDAVEEAKKKTQPWECEVTVFPQGDAPPAEAAPMQAAQPAEITQPTKKAAKKPVKRPASEFSCDEPE
jgi:hypothetical protein